MELSDLIADCALMIGDPDYKQVQVGHWVRLAKQASYDLRNRDFYIQAEDNESLTVTAGQYEYGVPADFAYIRKIEMSDTIDSATVYLDTIPDMHWEPRLNGAVPVIKFHSISSLIVGRSLKVIGQKRPTLYNSPSQQIDPGMESYLRERMLYFAFRLTGAGVSDLARWRQQMSMQSYADSDKMASYHPQEFRMDPEARLVPGR
jgi:hypothetical protein